MFRVSAVNQPAVLALLRNAAVVRQTHAVAEAVADDARGRAKKRTGAMARSLTAVRNDLPSGRPRWRVGWDADVAFYGPLVERGTKKTRRQPHLEPAAKAVRRRR